MIWRSGGRSNLSVAMLRIPFDGRINPLIEAYQGIFAGTRIATAGFAMETAGLGCPNLPSLDVVERPVRGMVPIPGQAARGLQPRHMELSRESLRKRF
jgi:hypothetical protein